MKLLKYGGISVIYVCLIQFLHGFLQDSLGGLTAGPKADLLAAITLIALIIPIIVIVVKALKINNLYNVRRFALRALKKNVVAVVVFAVVLFVIGSNCYVGYNSISFFSAHINTTNMLMLAFCHNVFDVGVTYVFMFILGVLGLASSYNLPLTGNER